MDEGLNIAVVGAGVSGIVSSHLLSRRHKVTVFEQDGRLGGHTSTVVLDRGPDQGLAVDTGFIVLNDRTYPLFHRFLDELEVPVRNADMSFGYLDEASGFCWAGTNLNGLFAQRRNLLSPRFWGLLAQARSFHRVGAEALAGGTAASLSLGQWLQKEGFRGPVLERYIAPMGAAIWSAPYRQILEFPAETYLRFFNNHGLLSITDRPQWQSVVGGSHSYLKAFVASFKGDIRLNSPVRCIRRGLNGVELE
ncbi:MAG: NAD(P)-binding protein, partial [bacterium]